MKNWIQKETKNVFAGATIKIGSKSVRIIGTRQQGEIIYLNTKEFGHLAYLHDEKVEVWL